ncbi:adenosylcobyric acid synthase (glutamine-hydrolyzing) [Deferribacter desulfuricans SSM1]|uniref:Cobyric acid synthase n=1 Tax=Deferribacter desulfuricans (strain DSM 14783 / JCM 11476 / NBRC 101012 / SSM1) TaxID=639282 RepID=D3P9V6_DEFDS|nr:cobyric acid synthase [Deferribacter desulfuricans]BAI81496.1 adenosylcobyric acid synthase (glutamine-hydrolyzing) [Deferribacter desulfuricans SSM1]
MKIKHIMIQGTSSNVGKSIITAGICRMLANKGYKVAPFKAQNMALNSGVTFDGLEMGRAQILQAEACKILPDVRMNPILLKPTGGGKSQVIRLGKPYKIVSYKDYYKMYEENLKIVKEAFYSLSEEFDIIVLEGAGSPAEINLQKFDIVNMKMAEIANAKIYIVGDIDRGGVFAAFKGTYDLIQPQYKKLVKGFIINKFRGDLSLLKPGIDEFKNFCDIPIIGVIPYFEHNLEDEDSQNLFTKKNIKSGEKLLNIGIIKLPHISNFTDFQPLENIEKINVSYVTKLENLENNDFIIIPGSKNTVSDMDYLLKNGFYEQLKNLYGKKWIMGICGGFQMLGKKIIDSLGVENKGDIEGFGFIDMITEMEEEKILKRGEYLPANGFLNNSIQGYEIHHGNTIINDRDVIDILENKGLLVFNKKNRIIGTYLHGIFENSEFLQFIFKLFDKQVVINKTYNELKEETLNKLADLIENCIFGDLIND